MPALFDAGPYSGIQSKKLIEDLVKLEKKPQERYKRQKNIIRVEIQALEELRKRTRTLQLSLKTLGSFEAAFNKKAFQTAPEGFISGTANKKAEPGEHRIKILNLAQALKLSSKQVKKGQKFKKAKVGLGESSRTFNGGNIRQFKNFLNSNFSKDINAQVVNINGRESVLVIESKKIGTLIDFKDPAGLLAQLEILGSSAPAASLDNSDAATEPDAKDSVREKVDFTSIDMLQAKAERVKVAADKKSITLTGDAQVKIKLNLKKKAGFLFSGLNASAKAGQLTEPEDKAPAKVNVGPKEELNIKGIKVQTYNVDRQRKKPEKTYSGNDYGVIVDGKKISLAKVKSKFIPLSKEVAEIILYNNSPKVSFKPIEVVYKKEPKKEENTDQGEGGDKGQQFASNKELLDAQKQKYKNIVAPARKAELEINGIKVERDQNNGLTDLIDGATVDLQRASKEEIKVTISKNNSKAKEQILDFVKKYNDLIKYYIEASRHTEIKQAGQYDKMRRETGILVNNASARSLINGLKFKAMNAYPSVRKPHIKLLAGIGISTGKAGSDWKDIRLGLLQVDEGQLEEMLSSHPDAVKELFIIDTNGDNRPDHGFALKTERFLRPFTTNARGIISEQIKSKQEQSESLNKAIAKNEEHVEKYKKRLQSKFGYMEGKVGRQKAIGNMLKNRLGPRK